MNLLIFSFPPEPTKLSPSAEGRDQQRPYRFNPRGSNGDHPLGRYPRGEADALGPLSEKRGWLAVGTNASEDLAQAAGEADRQYGAVAQATQIHIEDVDHGEQFVGEDRLLLHGRPAVLAADAGEDRRYMAVARVARVAKLAVMPANPGQAAPQRGDACPLRAVSGADVSNAGGDSAVGAGGEIEPDRLRIGRQL